MKKIEIKKYFMKPTHKKVEILKRKKKLKKKNHMT